LEAYDYYLRGKEYFWRSTPETNVQARQLFERAIELDPQFALAYTWQGITYLREWAWLWSLDPQTLEQAFALAQKALALDDSLATAHGLLGLAYARKGQPEQGLAKGERGIALDPNCAECYIDLAEILLLAERPEEALGLVEKAMHLDPQAAAYYSGDLGWAYRLLGRYEEAIAAQKRVLTRNPDFLPAHVELARMYHELRRAEEAQAEEAAVRRLNPYFPLEFLREKASLKEQKEEFDRFFKRSLTDNLKARAYFFGGFGYFFRDTQEAQAQARQLWEKAIELDPQFAWAHTFLCATYLSEWSFQWSQDPQTLERALTLARRAVALDDSLPPAHEFLGLVYMYKKQYEHAIVEAERSIALDPNDGDAYANLGFILAFAGQPEEAIKVVEKGMHLNSRFPARHLSALGMAYRLTGQYERALDALHKALPLNPNWLPTHLFLAVIYSELGREEEARAEVGEILRLSPNYSLEVLRQRSASKDPAETERFLVALRKAGLQ
jgi:tetratricopeptide (TPR) repeat protein